MVAGKHRNYKFSSFNPKQKEQIKKGIIIEKEHTDSDFIAKEIAKDHVVEIPDYYDRLEIMEKNNFWDLVSKNVEPEPEVTEYKCPKCGKPLLESSSEIFCDDRNCGFDKEKDNLAWELAIDRYDLEKVKK